MKPLYYTAKARTLLNGKRKGVRCVYLFVFLPINLLCLLAAACCVQEVLRECRAPTLAPGIAPITQPFISVLIPARNEAERIGACMAGLSGQSYRNFELLVVDD